jgi:uncharacterized protein YidB (DUF937 family)
MGLFDDAVPGGNITKPLLIALGALLVGKMFGGGNSQSADDVQDEVGRAPPPARDRAPAPQTQPSGNDGGILGGGLGDLLERLRNQGQGKTTDSWVRPDTRNDPIAPTDLGRAIGPAMLDELARRTGIPQDQLLEQLSKVLPGVVDKLTPGGRIPSNHDVADEFRRNPWG